MLRIKRPSGPGGTTPVPAPKITFIGREQPETPPPPQDETVAPEIEAGVRMIGLIMYNTLNACWLSKSDIFQTVHDAYTVVHSALEKHEEIRFTVREDDFLANGAALDTDHPHIGACARQLAQLQVNNLTLRRGLTRDEFNLLADLLSEKAERIEAEGGFLGKLSDPSFEHVLSRKVTLKEVAEDEAVVLKKQMEDRRRAEVYLMTVLAGQGTAEADRVLDPAAVRQVAEDTGCMADLIVKAAIGDQPADGSEEQAQRIAGCLTRAFDEMARDPFSKTQKGKKLIAKVFTDLEGALIERIGATAGDARAALISETIEEVTDRLRMDAVVGDYVKKLKAIEKSEQRILRFIKAQGIDRLRDAQLEEQIGDHGLDVSGWERLLALSVSSDKTGREDDQGFDRADAAEGLASLLGRLEDGVRRAGVEDSGGSEGAAALSGDVTNIDRQVRAIVDGAEARVRSLVSDVSADMELVDKLEREARQNGQELKLPRRRLLQVLAELVQELCQPLSVIDCSITMVTSKTLGEVTPTQLEILQLAGESASRIRKMISNLERLSGLPVSLTPDASIQKSLHE